MKKIHDFDELRDEATEFPASLDEDSNPHNTFDPNRWKTSTDSRLDPTRPIKIVSAGKLEIKKPPTDHYIHAHPDPNYNSIFPLYSDSDSGRRNYDPYLLAPDLPLPPQVAVNIIQTRLVPAITDMNKLFLWHVAQTGSTWHESGDASILTAMTRWAKVLSDDGLYRLEFPEAHLPDPQFPDWPFAEYLARAFKDRYIANVEHPIIKRLAGKV